MHVRSPGIPDEPAGDRPASHAPDDPGPDPDATEPGTIPGEVVFQVPVRVMVAKLATASALAVASLLAQNPSQLTVGVVAVMGVLIYASRDVIARERLRADPSGVVVVRGFAGRRRLAWSQLEAVRVDAHTRLGARSELLELDAGEEIFLFSRFDLGLEPEDALDLLTRVRPDSADQT